MNDSSAAMNRVGGAVALAPLGGRIYKPSVTPLPIANATYPSVPPPVGTHRAQLANVNGLVARDFATNAL